MDEYDAFTMPGSSQQQFPHSYNLWENSAYYNINDLSAKNLLVKESDDQPCSWSKPQKKELERDSKNRRVVSKESLYDLSNIATTKLVKSPEPIEDPTAANSWTAQYWKKPTLGNEQATLQPQRNIKHNAKPNKLLNKLNKALSQPLKIDKAASIMAKMGWDGGALGKSGVGIVEPIAPNTEYALATTGFGKPEPKPKPPKPPKFIKRSVTFNLNVLRTILDFVKNDYEVEVTFEAKLQNGERKRIHQMVERVSNEEYGDDVEENYLIDEILKYNQWYVLRTISEGVRPNRKLCLYKEAPDHLYLVTHLDLRYDQEDSNETDEQTDTMDMDVIDITDDIEEDLPTKDEVIELDKSKTNDINHDNVINEVEIVKIDEKLNNGEDKSISKLNNTDNNVISKKRAGPNNKHKRNRPKKIPKPKIESKPRKIVKRENKFSKVTENTLKQETNPFMKSILSVQTDKEKDDTNKVLTKTDLRNQILEYFDEFTKTDLYTEFKFLGPFEGIEIEAINEFIGDLWSCLTTGDCLDQQIVNVVKESTCGIAITTDANGSALIYKTKEEESGT